MDKEKEKDFKTVMWFPCQVVHFQKLHDKDCVSSRDVNRLWDSEKLKTKLLVLYKFQARALSWESKPFVGSFTGVQSRKQRTELTQSICSTVRLATALTLTFVYLSEEILLNLITAPTTRSISPLWDNSCIKS